MQTLFIYGPPGSGKTTLGKLLAGRFGVPFEDLDDSIVSAAEGKSIPAIFADEGEPGFRARERAALEAACAAPGHVVALGGGALLDPACRELAESHGQVVCLDVPADVLKARIASQAGTRPLADAAEKVDRLLATRSLHYDSFPVRPVAHFAIDSGDEPSDVFVGRGLLDTVGTWASARKLGGRAVVVGDSNTFPLYGERILASLRKAGFAATALTIPAGEETKTIDTVMSIWRAFLAAELGRGDFAVAVGGGVVGDMTGFAAAAWMRGMRWINVPTSLLAMVDASTGGKTGCDLPEAKNMVGAFHSPTFVLADTATLETLPPRELACGMAETIKHGFIADPGILDETGVSPAQVARSLAVKVKVVTEDAKEKGVRAKLNLGHTVGHALEIATNFAVKHGEAVAIGTVEEARLAVRLGLAPAEWPDRVAAAFAKAGLPTVLPDGITFESLAEIMRHDKKQHGGKISFALPCAPGDARLVPVAV